MTSDRDDRRDHQENIAEQPVGEAGIIWVRLTATMLPGNTSQSDNAEYLVWDGTDWVVTGEGPALMDPKYLNFGITGEDFQAIWVPEADRYECVGSQGLLRRGKTQSEITEDDSGNVAVWRYEYDDSETLADTGFSVIAHNTWGAGDLESGVEVWIVYQPDSRRWIAVSATSVSLWRFTLNANMTANQAAADKLQMDGTDTGDDITVKDPDGAFSRALNGAKGICAQVGDSYYVLECQSKAGWIRFSLNADLAGGSALATKTDFGGSQQDVQDPGTTVTVHDGAGLFKRAKASCLGLATYDAVDDEYVVVECQTLAGWIRFELTADMSSGNAACDVKDYGGSQNDVYNPGTTTTVYDDAGNFPNALDEAKGEARYDSVDGQYKIIHCNQMCFRLRALVDEGSGVASTDSTFDVDNIQVGSPKPFNQLPPTYVDANTNLTVNNRYEMDLDDDAEVDLQYNGSSWDCVQGTCPA